MEMEKWSSLVCRVFFAGAFVLLILAILERIANGFGYTITAIQQFYTAARLLDFAGLLLVFVIALLLREVRETLRSEKR